MHKFKPLLKFYLRLGDDFSWVPECYSSGLFVENVGNLPIHSIAVKQYVVGEHTFHKIFQTTAKGDKQASFTGDFPNDVKTVSHARLGGVLGIPTDEVEQELIKLFKAFEIII